MPCRIKITPSPKCHLYPSHVLAFPPAGPCMGQACAGWVCSSDRLWEGWEMGEAFPTLSPSLCIPATQHRGRTEVGPWPVDGYLHTRCFSSCIFHLEMLTVMKKSHCAKLMCYPALPSPQSLSWGQERLSDMLVVTVSWPGCLAPCAVRHVNTAV